MSDITSYQLDVSPEGVRLLEELSARLGQPKGRVFSLAISLLKLSMDMKRDGKAVGAAESADWLETEFTGF